MPAKVVLIPISKRPFPEAGATFLSELAFPRATGSDDEKLFWPAVCRSAILARSVEDLEWGLEPQPIRPLIFVTDTEAQRKAIRFGETRLNRLFMAASTIIPVIVKHLTNRQHLKFGWFAEKMKIKKVKRDAMKGMGWHVGSRTTFSSRYWHPGRPVLHAAAACILGIGLRDRVVPWPPHIEFFNEYFASPIELRKLILLSEVIRQQPLLLQELHIKEEETVQFLPD
jgi:hypothetical protein